MSARRAFALGEVVVLVAGGAVAIALLLPGIQKMWQEAARLASQDNLRKIGQAAHKFHDKAGHFPLANYAVPTGKITVRSSDPNVISIHSGFVDILPYVGQEKLAKKWDPSKHPFLPPNDTLATEPLKVFLDPGMPKPVNPPHPSYSSYAWCAGNREFGPQLPNALPSEFTPADGVIVTAGDGGPVKIKDVADGASTTLMAGEMHYLLENFRDGNVVRNGLTNWSIGIRGMSFAYTAVPMNTVGCVFPYPANANWTQDCRFGFKSARKGGINFLFADGSVRFLRTDMKHDLYQGLGSRSGGEKVKLGGDL